MKEKGISPEELIYERQGSYLFTGEVREKMSLIKKQAVIIGGGPGGLRRPRN